MAVALVTEKDCGQHFVVLVIIGQKFEQMDLKKCQMNHDNSFDKNIPDANSKKIIQSKKILPVALVTEKDHGQHFVVLVIIGQKFEQMGPKKMSNES